MSYDPCGARVRLHADADEAPEVSRNALLGARTVVIGPRRIHRRGRCWQRSRGRRRKQREAVRLPRQQGLTPTEVARALGVSPGAVPRRAHARTRRCARYLAGAAG